MAEYIEKETLINALESEFEDNEHCRLFVSELPTADVVEVRHGQWLLERDPDGKPYCFHCSVCDLDFHHISVMSATDYCPNCGAKMDGKDGAE